MSSSPTVPRSYIPSTPQLWLNGLLGGIVGAAINLILLWLAQLLYRGPIEVPMPPANAITPLPWWQVGIMTIVPALIATALYWLLLRFVPNARRIFLIIGIVVLLVSLAGPLGLPIASSIKSVLALMHVVAAVSILGFLTR